MTHSNLYFFAYDNYIKYIFYFRLLIKSIQHEFLSLVRVVQIINPKFLTQEHCCHPVGKAGIPCT